MRIGLTFLVLGALGAMWLAGGSAPVLAGPAARHSGSVVAVDPQARTLVIDELERLGKERKLTVRIAQQAQVVLSERLPDDQVADLRHPFRDTPISLSDIRPGDFVVVELTEKGNKAEAISVTVTFRGGSR